MKIKKQFYTFKIDNAIDVITNSSSELFIFKSTEKILLELLDSIEKDFGNKYAEPTLLRNCSNSNFSIYICSLFEYNVSDNLKHEVLLPEGIKFEDVYIFDEDSYSWYFETEEYNDEKGYYDKLDNFRDIFQNWLDPNDQIWILYVDDYLIPSEIKTQLKLISTYEYF
jgi:hypothetical protein